MRGTCVNHKQAQYVCINTNCNSKCAYVCIEKYDSCKQDHEQCELMSLEFFHKKCSKITTKKKEFNSKTLHSLLQICKEMVQKVQNLLRVQVKANQVRQMLDSHGLIQGSQKQVLCDFSKIRTDKNSISSTQQFQKSLMNLDIQINNYLSFIKQKRQKQGQEMQFRSEIQNKKEGSRMVERSPQRSKITKSKVNGGPSAVKSGMKQSNLKINQISPVKSSNNFQQKISSIMKHHIPKAPLFSSITNDIQTIQTFFYEKFSGATLLYRASQNGFSAVKFHEKCDGHKNTLTILVNEFDRILGGFTPLQWRSSGGQWYEDQKQGSFIFNLTSGERYPIQNKSKAIWCSHNFGPSFGYPDLQIADKAIYNNNSCVNFPQCYNNGNYNLGTGSTQLLCGTKTGHFKIKQWEVYQLQF